MAASNHMHVISRRHALFLGVVVGLGHCFVRDSFQIWLCEAASTSSTETRKRALQTNNQNPLETLRLRKPPLSLLQPPASTPTRLSGHESKRHKRPVPTNHSHPRGRLLLCPSYGEDEHDTINNTTSNATTEDWEARVAVERGWEIWPECDTDMVVRLQPLVSSTQQLYFDNVVVVAGSNETYVKKRQSTDPGVVAVEGLFGVYPLPSGQLWVWIASSERTYETPPVANHSSSWWQIRKVQQLHLMHMPFDSLKLSRAQQQEEARQLILLRQALKDHEWYYCDNRHNNTIVPDMTFHLQHCFSHLPTNTTEPQSPIRTDGWWQTTLEQQHDTENETEASTPYYPDQRFFWNEGVLKLLLEQYRRHNSQPPEDQPQKEALKFLLNWSIPVTSAFVGVQRHIALSEDKNRTSRAYDQLLISRRSKWRAGTRFTKRGADASGNVANYAESEQVVLWLDPGGMCQQVQSHVQTRGSIPLRWSSPTDIKTYRPRVRLGSQPLAQAKAMRQHLVDQASRYILSIPKTDDNKQEDNDTNERTHPGLVLVNLVDKKSDQGRLGRAMDSVLKAVLDVYEQDTCQRPENAFLNSKMIQHVWFDFHHEVKGGRWDRLKSLLTELQPTLKEQSYFQARWGNDNGAWQIERRQTGVVRTNCMDCLDRTNVVQSLFAREMLFDALQHELPKSYIKSFRSNPLSLPWSAGEAAHRMLWADNADAISRLYSGTPALKRDFTRTGKRTKRGALDDGVNSIQRYMMNNFLDADRQEGIDLLTRHQEFSELYEGDENSDAPSADAKSTASRSNNDIGMSIQDAARKLLMGSSLGSLYGDSSNDDDESDHVRAKVKPEATPLFTWLPGDLQSQMKSLASSLSNNTLLWGMDQRAARDSTTMPWWAMDNDDEDSSADNDNEQDEQSRSDDTSSLSSAFPDTSLSSHAGYVTAALIASVKAPLTTAAFVLSMAGLSMAAGVRHDDTTEIGTVDRSNKNNDDDNTNN